MLFSTGQPHGDLWSYIAQRAQLLHIRIVKVRAHSGIAGNEAADFAAKFGRDHPTDDSQNYVNWFQLVMRTGEQVNTFQAPPDTPPTDEEISAAIRRLQKYRCKGPDEIAPGTVKALIDKKDENGEPEIDPLYEPFSSIIKKCWEKLKVPPQFIGGRTILLRKVPGSDAPADSRGITILPIAQKVVSGILDARAKFAPNHRAQHGFTRGTSTNHAVLELKLRIRRARRENKRLYIAFIDIMKAYDCVSRETIIEALTAKGFGTHNCELLRHILENDRIVLDINGACSSAFHPTRGTLQGDVASPTIFNAIMDLVIREFEEVRGHSMLPIFFADDGALTAYSMEELQRDLDALNAACSRYGLSLSVKKTKLLVTETSRGRMHQDHMRQGVPTRERKLEVVECSVCGTSIARGSLQRHYQTAACRKAAKDSGRKPPSRKDVYVDPDDTDEESIEAFISRNLAERRYLLPPSEGRFYYVNMPKALGNAPIPCPACKPVPPPAGDPNRPERPLFDSRTRMDMHLTQVHHGSGVFDPLRDLTKKGENGSPYTFCDVCKASCTIGGLEKHRNSVKCTNKAAAMKTNANLKMMRCPTGTLKLHGAPVERVQSFRYLGALIDEELSDSAAVDDNCRRAHEAMGRLRGVMGKNALTPARKRALCDVIVNASLLFGCETWALDRHMIAKLRTMQQRMLRIATGKMPKMHASGHIVYPAVKDVLKSAKTPDVITIIRRRRLAFACKVCLRTAARSPVTESFKNESEHSSRGWGGHRPDWVSQMIEDLELAGINTATFEKWREKVENFLEPRTRAVGQVARNHPRLPGPQAENA